ncbi:MAG: fused MFS/spermidine synthase [Archangium sp.]|nr:fused MFS/spermidine synthase [Archangium sp.]
MRRLAVLMFTLSGAAGLVFEVALQRSLTRAFGVSAFATSTVLAAWMTGLALGAVAFGRLADRVKSPLKMYAWLEFGIGGAAALTPSIIPMIITGFASLAQGAAPNAPGLLLGRLVLAFALTLIPTLLMGGTLPTVARALAGDEATLAKLYTANLVGAVLGALLGSYVSLPDLGLSRTMWFGALLNVAAGLIALLIAKDIPLSLGERVGGEGATTAPKRLLFLSAWSGFATFAAEVTWFQLLAVVVGTSVYAFGLMLATFLVGLSLGSAWVSRAKEVEDDHVGRVTLATAVALLVTLPLWEKVPAIFIAAGPHVTSFAGRELVRAVACLALLLLPSAALGALFPMVLRLAWRAAAKSTTLGGISAANTLGAVVGSLATAFFLLPSLGTRNVLVIVIAVSTALAMWLLKGRFRWAPGLVLVFLAMLSPWNLGKLGTGANVYFRTSPYEDAQLVWAHEAVESGLTSVIRNASGLTMLTNGKFQGNDSGEVDAQRAFTQLPMLIQRDWDRALLIGIGTGCSLGVLAAQPFKEVEAAELAEDVLTSARDYFGHVNDQVLAPSSRVKVHRGDGRNVLLLTTTKYDLITIELSSIWFAGASDLYNREFYGLAREHLTERGVLQQWVQLHHLTRRDLAVILQSIRAELPHVALFYSGGQGIVLASRQPIEIDYAGLLALSTKLRGTAATAGIPGGDLLTLQGKLALDEAGVAALIEEEAKLRGVTVEKMASTDDSLYLEYSTPRANANDELKAQTLIDSLSELPTQRLPVVNAPSDDQQLHATFAYFVGRNDADEAKALSEKLGSFDAAAPLLAWLATITQGSAPSP